MLKITPSMSKLRPILIVLFIVATVAIGFEVVFYLALSYRSNTVAEVVKKSANTLYDKSAVKNVNTISADVIKMDSWEQKKKFLISSYVTTEGVIQNIGKTNFPKKFSLTLSNASGESYIHLYTDTDVEQYLLYKKVGGVNKTITLNDLKVGDHVTVREIYEVKNNSIPTKINLEIIVL
ncbi:MAG: hypothetical protein V1922_04395 [bacterium]